jgi:chaperonin cofactor prefoldin
METVRERLDKAQKSGNREEIRRALEAAREAGADSASIDQALAELDRLGSESRPEPEVSGNGSIAQSAVEDEAAQARVRADGLKKRGNESLKANTKSAAREALECYTAGLEVACDDRVLNAQLLSNRAHARILLKQYVEAVDDCRKAIEMDPKNMKAYWRAARASLNLDLCRNGIDFCEAGLRLEPNDADLMKLRSTCADKLAAQQLKRQEMAAASRSHTDFNADDAMAVQDKVDTLKEQCDMMKNSLMSKHRERHRSKFTHETLSEMPVDTGMYIGVGRTFVMEDRDAIIKRLSSSVETLDEEIPKLAKTHEEMEKRKEAAEKELQEMISSFKKPGS